MSPIIYQSPKVLLPILRTTAPVLKASPILKPHYTTMSSGTGAAITPLKVLGIGVPATASFVPWIARSFLQKSLNTMDADMEASKYDWEMLYTVPEDDFGLVTSKLKEKKWDIVMVGMGLRKTDSVITFFEQIVNAVHTELPEAKFAFNDSIEKAKEAIDRVANEESK